MVTGLAVTAVAATLGAGLGPWLPSAARRFCITSRPTGFRFRIGSAVALSALFTVVGLRFGTQPLALAFVVLAVAGVLVCTVDLAERRLPNAIVLPTTAVVTAILAVVSLMQGRPAGAIGALAGAVGMFALYLLLTLITPGGIGMGDVKLASACGAALGCLGLGSWLVGLAAAFLLNGIAAIAALALRRTTLRGSLPFGPSMIAAVFIAVTLS
jgi:leader peptidase (prepilin peptidase)/N-methyltransferase